MAVRISYDQGLASTSSVPSEKVGGKSRIVSFVPGAVTDPERTLSESCASWLRLLIGQGGATPNGVFALAVVSLLAEPREYSYP